MRSVSHSAAMATGQNLIRGLSAGLCALPLILVPAGTIASGADAGGRAIAAALADPLSIFASRSPGQRAAGALTQTKGRLASGRAGNRPTERVLAGVRARPAAAIPALVGPLTEIVPGASPFVLPVNAGGVDSTPLAPTGGPVFGGVGGGGPPFLFGGGGPGVGGGGGGGGGATPDTPVVPIVPNLPAVPEPGAWLMMIAGFMSIGAVLRLRFRRSAVLATNDIAP